MNTAHLRYSVTIKDTNYRINTYQWCTCSVQMTGRKQLYRRKSSSSDNDDTVRKQTKLHTDLNHSVSDQTKLHTDLNHSVSDQTKLHTDLNHSVSDAISEAYSVLYEPLSLHLVLIYL